MRAPRAPVWSADLPERAASNPVRLLEERRFAPPRQVEVEQDGAWWPGTQRAWRLCDDGRGWMADVEWIAQHHWGPGKYMSSVPPVRVRLRES